MVKEFGMSRLGRVSFHERGGPNFLGSSGFETERNYSERTAREIDIEVRSIIEEATREVRGVLQMRRGALEAIAQRLIEKEVIEGSELRQLLELHTPGPRLLPGSDAVQLLPEIPPNETGTAAAEPSL
jgi:cell division protease FtsH